MIAALLLVMGGMGEPPALARDEPPAVIRTTRSERPRKAIVVAGWHEHRCGVCGTAWQHGLDQHGIVESHRCPTCGRVQWQIYRWVR